MFDLTTFVEIFFLGVVGTCVLGAISVVLYCLYLVIQSPFILSCIAVGLFFVFMVGWCMKHYDDFHDLFFQNKNITGSKSQIEVDYGISTLDRLLQFEKKHHMSTVSFMSFVYDNRIPAMMDNLDYLEWIALVNDLPNLASIDKKRNGEN